MSCPCRRHTVHGMFARDDFKGQGCQLHLSAHAGHLPADRWFVLQVLSGEGALGKGGGQALQGGTCE
jgi:hypothetical protein